MSTRVGLWMGLFGTVLAAGGCVTAKKSSVDPARTQSLKVKGAGGVGFSLRAGGTTAHVAALPGAFPDGAEITLGALADDRALEGRGRSTAFSLKATLGGSSLQPARPILLGLETTDRLAPDSTLVAYAEGATKGQVVPSRVISEGERNQVTAEVDHLTIFRIGSNGEPILLPPPPKPQKGEWRLMVSGRPDESFVADNEAWSFDVSLELTATNRSGTLSGEWVGNAVVKLKGQVKSGLVKGPAAGIIGVMGNTDGGGAGPARFTLAPKPYKNSPVKTHLRPGDPAIDVGAWLDGEGQIKLFTSAKLRVAVTAPGGGKVHDDSQDGSGTGELYTLRVLVCQRGTWVQIDRLGIWRGVLVGSRLK